MLISGAGTHWCAGAASSAYRRLRACCRGLQRPCCMALASSSATRMIRCALGLQLAVLQDTRERMLRGGHALAAGAAGERCNGCWRRGHATEWHITQRAGTQGSAQRPLE